MIKSLNENENSILLHARNIKQKRYENDNENNNDKQSHKSYNRSNRTGG